MSESLSDSCIHLDERRISRRRMIPCGVYFELNRDILAEIDLAQKNCDRIELSDEKLTNLRYYALLSFIEYRRFGYHHTSELVFSTNYLRHGKQVTVVRSVINPEGKITQQIQENLWQNLPLCDRLIQAHYWLIFQILTQLPLPIKNYNRLLSWTFALMVTVASAIPIFYWLSLSWFIKILLLILLLVLFKIVYQYLLAKLIRLWILHQLVFGFLANGTKKRHIGLKLLSIFGVRISRQIAYLPKS